jgi:hypothetical protein
MLAHIALSPASGSHRSAPALLPSASSKQPEAVRNEGLT